jgi:hypothetical protein
MVLKDLSVTPAGRSHLLECVTATELRQPLRAGEEAVMTDIPAPMKAARS